jgi:hypothetical protein
LTASASDPTSHARLYIGLVTPHSAALSASENERIVELFVANLRRYLDGEPLVNVVEPGVLHEKVPRRAWRHPAPEFSCLATEPRAGCGCRGEEGWGSGP